MKLVCSQGAILMEMIKELKAGQKEVKAEKEMKVDPEKMEAG